MVDLMESVKTEPADEVAVKNEPIEIQLENGKLAINESLNLDFKCRFCSKLFHKSYNKKRHEDTVHAKKVEAPPPPKVIEDENKCKHCSFSTKFMNDLKLHEASVHPKKTSDPYAKSSEDQKCKYCNFSTKFLNDLKLHESTVHLKKTIESTNPKKIIESANPKKTISPTKSTDDRKCSLCSYLTKFAPDLKAHEALVHGKKRAHQIADGKKCSFCNYSSRSDDYLEKHEALVHLNKRNQVPDKINPPLVSDDQKCNFCNFSTKFDNDLLIHMEVHIEKPNSKKANIDEGKKCKFCDFSTKFISDLRAHAEMTHPDLPMDPDLIDNITGDITNGVSEEGDSDYRCSFASCSKKFTEHHKKIRHEAVAHLQDKPEKDPLMSYLESLEDPLSDPKTMIADVKIGKEGKSEIDDFGVYKCDYCFQMFTRKSSKVRHEMSNKCSKLTRTVDLLPNNLNCFPCRYCNKLFSKKENQLVHEKKNMCSKLAKVCEGVLPSVVASTENESRSSPDLQCQFCQRVFSRADKRRSHEQNKVCLQT